MSLWECRNSTQVWQWWRGWGWDLMSLLFSTSLPPSFPQQLSLTLSYLILSKPNSAFAEALSSACELDRWMESPPDCVGERVFPAALQKALMDHYIVSKYFHFQQESGFSKNSESEGEKEKKKPRERERDSNVTSCFIWAAITLTYNMLIIFDVMTNTFEKHTNQHFLRWPYVL